MNNLYSTLLILVGLEALILSVSGYHNLFTTYLTLTLFATYAVVVFFIVINAQDILKYSSGVMIKTIAVLKTAVYTAIFIFAYYLSDKQGSLIPVDANLIHIPQILSISDMIINNSDLPTLSTFGKYYYSNYYFSILYILFGDLEVAIIVGLIILLLANITLIYKNCAYYFENSSAGKIALLVIFLSQSFYFYSLQLYKEGFFYLIVNIFIYSLLRRQFIIAGLLFYIIFHERFYAAIIFAIAAVLALFAKSSAKWKLFQLVFVLCSFLLAELFVGISHHTANVISVINNFSTAHSVSDAGLSVPFPFTIVQISLSPIPNMYKMETWIYQDRLLIMSFIFSCLVSLAVIKLLIQRKSMFLVWCCYSYIGYIALWSWVAPFNGRARDGIFPIIVIIVCAGLFNLKKKGT